MTGRRGIRRKQLLDDVKEKRICWKLTEEEPVDNSLWKGLWTCLKTGCRMNELHFKVFGRRVVLPAHTIMSCLFSKMRRSWRPCAISSPLQNRAIRF